jgi:hypothetical protein
MMSIAAVRESMLCLGPRGAAGPRVDLRADLRVGTVAADALTG